MAELTKLGQQTNDLTSAWDERKRTFDKLRKLEMDDDARKEAIAEYKAAAKHFDQVRNDLLK